MTRAMWNNSLMSYFVSDKIKREAQRKKTIVEAILRFNAIPSNLLTY